jgi:hypothetical protein
VATIFNESAIAAEPAVNGAARQHLLTKDRVSGTRILLDRLTLRPGGEARLAVPAQGLAWFQILEGEAALAQDTHRATLTDAHVAFLPPGYTATVTSKAAAFCSMAKFPTPPASIPELQKVHPHSVWSTAHASRCSIPSTTRASAFIW